MASEAPPFWWEKPGWQALLLAPVAYLYGAIAGRRMEHKIAPKVALPVLCIGNFTVGGAGKTPAAIAFAVAAKQRGLYPGIVSRGYGGSFSGLHLVDALHDSAKHTGDEPLLLARYAKTVISADRRAAAQFLAGLGCDFIIMDDGFQSARLYADYALMVVDAERGIGNGRVLPAGPLRAPLLPQMRKADALLRIGRGDGADYVIRQAARAAKPIYDAVLTPSSTAVIEGKRWLAFAGIGNPEKFFDSVRQMGGIVEQASAFGDHYSYSAEDVAELLALARKADLGLITTAKDHVRLATMPGIAPEFLEQLTVLDVELEFARHNAVTQILDVVQQRFAARQ